MEAAEKGDRRRRRCEQATKLKELARQERQQRYVFYDINYNIFLLKTFQWHVRNSIYGINKSFSGGLVERSVTFIGWCPHLV